MPVLKHAKKKVRQDKKRTLRNKLTKAVYRGLVKKAKVQPTSENLSAAFSMLDKAAKKNVIHKNKAARLKSALAKVLAAGPDAVKVVAVKKAAKKVKKVSKKFLKKATK